MKNKKFFSMAIVTMAMGGCLFTFQNTTAESEIFLEGIEAISDPPESPIEHAYQDFKDCTTESGEDGMRQDCQQRADMLGSCIPHPCEYQ